MQVPDTTCFKPLKERVLQFERVLYLGEIRYLHKLKVIFVISLQEEDTDTDKNRTESPQAAAVYQCVTKLATIVESNQDELARLNSKMDEVHDTLKTILNKLTEAEGNDGRQDSVDISSSEADQSTA